MIDNTIHTGSQLKENLLKARKTPDYLELLTPESKGRWEAFKEGLKRIYKNNLPAIECYIICDAVRLYKDKIAFVITKDNIEAGYINIPDELDVENGDTLTMVIDGVIKIHTSIK